MTQDTAISQETPRAAAAREPSLTAGIRWQEPVRPGFTNCLGRAPCAPGTFLQVAAMDPWLNLTLLGMEAQRVIWLRMVKLAAGGPKAKREAQRMVWEKMFAGANAAAQMALGANADKIVRGYRKKVRANRRRLSK